MKGAIINTTIVIIRSTLWNRHLHHHHQHLRRCHHNCHLRRHRHRHLDPYPHCHRRRHLHRHLFTYCRRSNHSCSLALSSAGPNRDCESENERHIDITHLCSALLLCMMSLIYNAVKQTQQSSLGMETGMAMEIPESRVSDF